MEKKLAISGVVVIITFIFLVSTCGYQRIDAGYEGLRVNKYGDEKGVDRVTEVTGAVWYNKIKYDIYEVPTFIQDYSFENLEFKTKDMMSVSLGTGVQVQNPAGKSPELFVEYRRYFDNGKCDLTPIIYKFTRQGFSDAVGMFQAEELITKKTEFRKIADSLVTNNLTDRGFEVGDIFLIGDPALPEPITQAVNNKIKAKQIAQQKEQELAQAKADADKLIEKARGEAESMKIQADAERYAYEQKQRALTKLLVQQQFIEKWNGVLPVYGEVPMTFKEVSNK